MSRKEVMKKISFILKCLIVLSAFIGITLCFIFAKRDGYSHWATRLMYFTCQSNIWIALSVLSILLSPYVKFLQGEKAKELLYILRYIFTVSIVVTGIVYCGLLAPFAYKENYNAWTLSNLITHVIVPSLSVADFIIDENRVSLRGEHVLFTAVPPLCYFVLAGILNLLNVDFGRGETYPYFFLNLKSEVGLFGAALEPEPALGTFYWILVLIAIVFGVALLLKFINSKILKKAS